MNTALHQKTELAYYLHRYRRLVWRFKWYILLCGPSIAALIIFAGLQTDIRNPELSAGVLIGIETYSRLGALQHEAAIGPSKVELIESQGFLADIIDRLELKLICKGAHRSEVFDSVSVDSNAVYGHYTFVAHADKNTYEIYLKKNRRDVNGRLVTNGTLSLLSTCEFPGVFLAFKKEFLRDPHEFTFSIVPYRIAIEWLQTMVKAIPPSRFHPDYFSVIVKGRDYPLITRIANTIADTYVEKNLDFRRRRGNERIAILESQLKTAAEEMQRADAIMRNFFEANPTIALDQQAELAVRELTAMETNSYQLQNSLDEGDMLLGQYQKSKGDEQGNIIKEMLAFLATKGVIKASVLQADIAFLLNERERLQRNYAPEHPLIKENREKIEAIGAKALEALDEYITKAQKEVWVKQADARAVQSKLNNLPQKKLALAELKRKQQIATEIHTNVLSQYNEAKVADAVEVADVYVIDYAVEPYPPSFPKALMRLIAMACLIGCALALGLPLAVDYLDRTARTGGDLARLTAIPLLETLPSIDRLKRSSKKLRKKEKKARKLKKGETVQTLPDMKSLLIISDAKPSYENEILRSLCTKVLYSLYSCSDKSVAITSLDSNAGKSTVAAGLAIAASRQGLKTLLIDADLRRGQLHRSFGAARSPGLSLYLQRGPGEAPVSAASLIQQTAFENLSIISAGENTSDSSELLSSPRMKIFKEEIAKNHDLIICDTPPIGAVVDAVMLNELFSRYILIARAGLTNIHDLARKIDEFPAVRCKVAGMVLNHAQTDRRMNYYRYSKYYDSSKNAGTS